MAKRTVQECDLTKLEYDPKDTVTIVIKKDGKKGRSYDLSPEAAAKLEQQLTAGPQRKLDANWQFGASRTDWEAVKTDGPKTLGEFDDDSFVAEKKRELKDRGELGQEREEPEAPVLAPALGASEKSDCLHMNKGPIKTTLRNKKRYAYRNCRQCGKEVAEKSMEDTQAYMAGKLPPDVNIRDLGDR